MEIANIPNLEHLDQGGFVVERGIPVMRPHRVYEMGADGKPDLTKLQYEVTEADLEEICSNANKPAEESGHFPRFTIGHTIKTKGFPEFEQPAKWIGAAVKYRVGQMPKSGAKVILADLYTQSDLEECSKGFPYRSAEYNWKEKRICGVAKLLKDPALHLGTVMCEAESHLSYGGGMETSSSEADETTEPKLDCGPAHAPLNPDEAVAADRLWAYFVGKNDGLKNLAASATNTALPDQKPEPAHKPGDELEDESDDEPEDDDPGSDKKPEDEEDEDMSKLQANDLVVAENEALKIQVSGLNTRLAQAAIKAELDRLELVENLEFDRAEAEVVMLERDEAGRGRYVESVRKFGRKKAGKAGSETPIQVLETEATVVSTPGFDPKKLTRDQFTTIQMHLAKNPGSSWESVQNALFPKTK